MRFVQATIVGILALYGLVNIATAAPVMTDIGSSAHKPEIEDLLARGIVSGYPDGTFRPRATINRAELITILMNARFPGQQPEDLRCFADLEVKIPQWYAGATCLAQAKGIVSGYPDGTFKPEKTVNLAEALTMSLRTFGIFPVPAGGPWYTPYLAEARNHGILIPLLKDPAHLLTRGEMASMTSRLVADDEQRQAQDPAPSPICGNGIVERAEQCDDSNVQDGDGCSSICVLVPEPVRLAFLQIDQQATGTLQTIARGQQNVTLLKFTAAAGRQDVLLTSVVLQASAGSLIYADRFRLVADLDGNGSYETAVQQSGRTDSSTLTFDQFIRGSVLIPRDRAIAFKVEADLKSNQAPVTIGLAFATGLPDYIGAQGAIDSVALTGIETDNHCSVANCFIRVNTQTALNVMVTDRGNLYVSEDSQAARSHLLLGGTETDTLLRLRLRAENEPIDMREIRIDGIINSIDHLTLWMIDPSGQKFLINASHGQCPDQPQARVCALLPLSTLIINPEQEVTVAITASMKTDALGAVSGQPVVLSLASATDTLELAVKAQGVSSQQMLIQNDGNGDAAGEVFIGRTVAGANAAITSRTHDTALASIVRITNDGPAHETRIPVGNQVIARYKIAAAAHLNHLHGSNDVILQSMTFHVTAQNISLNSVHFALSTADDPSATLNCTGGGSTGGFDVVCSGINAGTIRSHIAQGDSAVYQLSADIQNPAITLSPSVLATELSVLGNRAVTNSIVWSDGVTSFSWVDVPETSVAGTVYQSQ